MRTVLFDHAECADSADIRLYSALRIQLEVGFSHTLELTCFSQS